jgi:hypothetical protein
LNDDPDIRTSHHHGLQNVRPVAYHTAAPIPARFKTSHPLEERCGTQTIVIILIHL